MFSRKPENFCQVQNLYLSYFEGPRTVPRHLFILVLKGSSETTPCAPPVAEKNILKTTVKYSISVYLVSKVL